LSNLPRHILTQGTAIRGLMRNLGGSTGIPILVAQLTTNTQIVHSRLIEHLRPDNPMAQLPSPGHRFSLVEPAGIAALNAEVTRQASMVAYIDDFKLMMLVSLASIPLVLLLRRPRPPEPRPAAAD
jgi:DHA2 family multidrug resistance protein